MYYRGREQISRLRIRAPLQVVTYNILRLFIFAGKFVETRPVYINSEQLVNRLLVVSESYAAIENVRTRSDRISTPKRNRRTRDLREHELFRNKCALVLTFKQSYEAKRANRFWGG